MMVLQNYHLSWSALDLGYYITAQL